jgi:hypothetical protein
MRPAQKHKSALAFWIVREQADFTYEAAHLSIRSWSFDCYRFTEAHPFRRFFSFPIKGKVYLHTIVVVEAVVTATLEVATTAPRR